MTSSSLVVARQVLLIEAGKAYAPNAYLNIMRRQDMLSGDAAHDWGFASTPGVIGRLIPRNRGKVLAGTSAINGAVAMRLPQSDHARWAAVYGLTDFAWEDAQPHYRSLERTSGAGGQGKDGPFPIHQLGMEEVSDLHSAFVASTLAAGFKPMAGFNTPEPLGVGPYVMNARMGQRLNTGMTLLNDDVRARPNLTIRDETPVDRVIVEGGRGVRVRLADGAEIARVEIILSAGTYVSPAILMRSGIGPRAVLDPLGIPVIADLPVGKRLQDHPIMPTVWAIRAEAVGLTFPPIGAMLWEASPHAAPGEADINITTMPIADGGGSPTGAMFLLAAALVRPKSKGSLRIDSIDPAASPVIDLGFLRDSADRGPLIEAVEIIRKIATHAPFVDMVGMELMPGAAAQDRAGINAALAGALVTYQHPTSTVPMGGDNDPTALVDSQRRVRGIAGLRVVDASIWPDVPSVAMGFPSIMLAEHIVRSMMWQKPGQNVMAGLDQVMDLRPEGASWSSTGPKGTMPEGFSHRWLE